MFEVFFFSENVLVLLTFKIFFQTFLHLFELPGSHLSSIVGMNGKIFEPVNNGPKHPFWETDFFIHKEKCRTLDLWSLCIPQTVFKILSGFMLRKRWLKFYWFCIQAKQS